MIDDERQASLAGILARNGNGYEKGPIKFPNAKMARNFLADFDRDTTRIRHLTGQLSEIASLGNEYAVKVNDGSASLDEQLLSGIMLIADFYTRFEREAGTRQ